ncbi:MAG: tripartite tricarboxylate transporter TctB family protein [Rhizobiaceae bacterium]
MRSVDMKDAIGGVLVAVLGMGVATQSILFYQIGTVRHMGPGMFPTIIGLLLAGVGALIAVPAFFRQGIPLPDFEWRPLLTVLAAIAVFGLTLERFGLVVAVVGMTIMSVTADRKPSFGRFVWLPLGLALGAVLVFRIALGMNIPVFVMPF